jgi:hypothetical protein
MKKNIAFTKVLIPDGTYDALWSGYVLDILFPLTNDRYASVKTIDGVRGINCPVKVIVIEGDVYEI